MKLFVPQRSQGTMAMDCLGGDVGINLFSARRDAAKPIQIHAFARLSDGPVYPQLTPNANGNRAARCEMICFPRHFLLVKRQDFCGLPVEPPFP